MPTLAELLQLQQNADAYVGYPQLQRQAARMRQAQAGRIPENLQDPRTYGFVRGLMGATPDELGMSVLSPNTAAAKEAAYYGNQLSNLAQIAPAAAPAIRGAGRLAGEAINDAMVYGKGPLAKITPQPMRMFVPAEQDIAYKASRLEKKGLTPKEIHAELGVYRGPTDKQWRQELNDTTAHMKGSGTFEETVMNRMEALGKHETAEPVTVGDVFHHSDLFKHYPELKDIEVRFLPSDSKIDGRMAIPESGKGWLELRRDLSSKEARDVMLHELQHPIQEAEGWAVGGSSADFKHQDAATKARDILNWRNEVEKQAERMGLTPANNADWFRNAEGALVNHYHSSGAADWLPHEEARLQASWPMYSKGSDSRTQAEQLVKLYGLDKKTSPYTAKQMYNRLGGEVEARQVQARKDLTPEQRQQYFPGEFKNETNPYGYDTPLSDLLFLNRQGYFNAQDLSK